MAKLSMRVVTTPRMRVLFEKIVRMRRQEVSRELQRQYEETARRLGPKVKPWPRAVLPSSSRKGEGSPTERGTR